MTEVRGVPVLVQRRGPFQSVGGFSGWHTRIEVADFTEEDRPAYRVACHCRNCQWKGEVRARVGEKLPLWLHCPKCETYELSAHGEFKGRDDLTRDEEDAQNREADELAAIVLEDARKKGTWHY